MPDENKQWLYVCRPTLERMESKIDKIDTALNGNGKPGLRLDVDRMKQSHGRMRGFLAGAWAVVLACVAAAIHTILK